jgi:spore maturation protein SpmA
MKIGERGGVVNMLARLMSPLFCRLFPDIPKGHPVTGTIFMNIAANMLGLDNAATPLGLKAMEEMQELNSQKDTASNPMIMFLVLNTSGLTLIPVSVMVYRAQMGAAQPTDVFVPILLATFFSTIVGMIAVCLYQRINLFNRTMLTILGGACALVGLIIWGVNQLSREQMDLYSGLVANIFLFLIIIGFILAGMRKRINVYDAFVEGAKEGFQTAVRIIPYLVALIVGISMFRESGAITYITNIFQDVLNKINLSSDILPIMFTRSLSGSATLGLFSELAAEHGTDAFTTKLAAIMVGSSETTFYVLSVYFGAIGIKKFKYAILTGIIADFIGILLAIFVARWFFLASIV